jgi:hypothetical protein
LEALLYCCIELPLQQQQQQQQQGQWRQGQQQQQQQQQRGGDEHIYTLPAGCLHRIHAHTARQKYAVMYTLAQILMVLQYAVPAYVVCLHQCLTLVTAAVPRAAAAGTAPELQSNT